MVRSRIHGEYGRERAGGGVVDGIYDVLITCQCCCNCASQKSPITAGPSSCG